ncbi:fimbrillin family protein [Bacteroides mediterraneensis]|uniref:Fimbrillin family protein n=1 Tax=Bacteroides mediterraneensis TaxID=1841856 RepID=A0ABS2EU24_9BACE|nr:fimbrillin family protein [Bacteroides mediterraneensis]
MTKDATVETLSGLTVNMKGISTEGEFNLADGTLTATAGTNNKEVAMNVNAEDTTATAIILPTAAASEQTAINLTFNLSGQSFTYTIDNTSIFEKGTNVTFNANLSINNGKPVVTVGNATITAWTEKAGGDIDVNFDGETQPQPGEEAVVLNETFATGQGAFTINDKQIPEGGSYVWKHDAGTSTGGKPYYYMKASAFINKTNQASESWLVSPEVDLSTATTATLTFMHIINHAGDMQTQQTLWVTETSAENWQQVTIPNYPAGNNWTEVSSGNIDLSTYAGKKIKFAFKYVSTTEAAATWEIYDVKVVANGEGGGTVAPDPEPEPDPEPGTTETIFLETCGQTNVGDTKYKINEYTGWDNNGVLTFSDEFAGQYQNADVRATSTLDNNVWFPASTSTTEKLSGLKISGFNVANYTNLSLEYGIATNKTPANQNIIKVRTDKGDVAIESKEFTATNKYETVNVSLPDNITYIEFVSDANNTMGFRVDNIKLTGTKK